uniref:Uncharacterized protein n=1 Tax=Lepeophtheirus salmonis TaxID=72036 RepID=A0A0K2UP94_LEPSM
MWKVSTPDCPECYQKSVWKESCENGEATFDNNNKKIHLMRRKTLLNPILTLCPLSTALKPVTTTPFGTCRGEGQMPSKLLSVITGTQKQRTTSAAGARPFTTPWNP